MSREVRRASKTFDWKLKETWWGYLLDPIPCQGCVDGKTKSGDYCPVCEGEGEAYPKVNPPAYSLTEYKGLHEWTQKECDGWQMWETTSEGSPISPVFDTPEELAKWLADTNASAFGGQGASYESWLKMITSASGYAVSAMYSPATGIQSGVEAL